MNTRTNIVLDDQLVAKAMARAGVKTKKAAIEAALRAYVRKPDYSGLLALAGSDVLADDYDPKALFTHPRYGSTPTLVLNSPEGSLATPKGSTRKVEKVVETVKAHQHEAVHPSTVVHRPWGTYAQLKEEDGYQVDCITVKPGEALSLRYHHQCAQHLVVVKGTAMVQIGDAEFKTLHGEYRYIPLKKKYRLTNVGKDELVLVSVQCGDYLGKDDVVRLADTYGRV